MGVTAPRRHYTLEDYLGVEEMSSNVKHELVAGEIFAMAGGSVEHAALSGALIYMLTAHLRGGACRAYSSDLRIRILEADVATYADASVVCDPVERDPESPTHVTNPRVVFEVLSPSTAQYDRGEKREHYQRLQSLDEFVLVAQDVCRVELWKRVDEGWSHRTYGAGEEVPLDSIEFSLGVDELYEIAGLG